VALPQTDHDFIASPRSSEAAGVNLAANP